MTMMDDETLTVSADDLETLLFASGAIRSIEEALNAAKRDPWAQSAKGKLTQAYDRLSREWRNAKRAREGYPGANFADPTAEDLLNLAAIEADVRDQGIGAAVALGSPLYRIVQALHAKGLVELGVYREMVMWGDSGEVGSRDHPMIQRVRLTARGKKALEGAKGRAA
jgi:hypothetical protein